MTTDTGLAGAVRHNGNDPVSEWVGSNLPYAKRSTFAESHSRAPTVLLSRPPVQCEIFNDIDNQVSDWWRRRRDGDASAGCERAWGGDTELLVRRLWNVQLERREPPGLIERLSSIPSALLYVDAREAIGDAASMEAAIGRFAGKVAVLGKVNPWPSLGWHSTDVPCESADLSLVLWTNYDPCHLEYGQTRLLL